MLLKTLCILQIIELPSHPFFVGVQFHPEFKSRPAKPSALFLGKMAQNFSIIRISRARSWTKVGTDCKIEISSEGVELILALIANLFFEFP